MHFKKGLFIFTFYTLLFCSKAYAQFNLEKFNIFSTQVKDSFEIYISTPKTYNKIKIYDVVYYCDANIKSGKALRRLLQNTSINKNLNQKIFVGIGHIGNFHKLRPRDFLIPTLTKSDTLNLYEKPSSINNFYAFLTQNIIPIINAKFKINATSNSLIGHSFGGHFAFYCLFKNDNFFKHYYALSPSLWVKNYTIYKYIAQHKVFKTPKTLLFTDGDLEFLNKINAGNKQMLQFLNTKKYPNLIYTNKTEIFSNHNSAVSKSLKAILEPMR